MKPEHARFSEITKARITDTRELVISYDKRTGGFAFGELAEITEGGQHRKHFVGRNTLVAGISELQNIQNALAIVIHDAEEKALNADLKDSSEEKRYTAEEVKALFNNMVGATPEAVSELLPFPKDVVFKNYGEFVGDMDAEATPESFTEELAKEVFDDIPGQMSIDDVIPEEIKEAIDEAAEPQNGLDARELNELKIALRRGWVTQEKYDAVISGKEALHSDPQLTPEDFEDEEW